MLFLLNRSFTVRLGASGTFLFEYVPAGTYSLVIQVPGQTPVIQSVTVATSANTNLGTIAICPDNDHDGYTAATDCNDNNASIHPGATELCNGVDDNCNGTVDEGCPTCTDADADGYKAQASCGTLVDCNDNNATIHPGATELCNGVDDNCNGTVDEGFSLSSDTQNCGSCGNVCGFSNATGSCIGGTCQISTCNASFGNCDGNQTNGCEVNLTSDAANCGACGHACGVGESCFAGVCGTGK
jgi:hypothetical protein